jgi:hypothetical protein
MFMPATTYVTAAYLDLAEVRSDTITSRQAQRRAQVLDSEFNSTWRRFSFVGQDEPETVIQQYQAPDLPEETALDVQVRRLLSFASFPANWDGAGSARASSESVKWARMFLRAISSASAVPTPALHANGNALLLYGPEPYAEIEFTGDGHIIYYAQSQDQQVFSDEDELFDGKNIPAKLKAIDIR